MFKDALSASLGRAFLPNTPPYPQLQLIEAVDADAAAVRVSGFEGVRDDQEG